jgi:hypothetical protein
MIVRAAQLTSVVALAGAAAALAAPSPKTLALKSSDFPAGAKMLVISNQSGPGGTVYDVVFYGFKVGGHEEEVADKVWYVPKNAKAPVPGLVAGPESTYKSEVGQISGFKGEKTLSVPRYGDEQTAEFADYTNADGAKRAFGALVVRKGNIIWVVSVENCSSPLAPASCIFGVTPPKIAQATALVELKKYAAKQKARVG